MHLYLLLSCKFVAALVLQDLEITATQVLRLCNHTTETAVKPTEPGNIF